VLRRTSFHECLNLAQLAILALVLQDAPAANAIAPGMVARSALLNVGPLGPIGQIGDVPGLFGFRGFGVFPVPEPSTVALMVAGEAFVLAAGRGKRIRRLVARTKPPAMG
jgi:hypothetical protein